jgi:hypothetical protein
MWHRPQSVELTGTLHHLRMGQHTTARIHLWIVFTAILFHDEAWTATSQRAVLANNRGRGRASHQRGFLFQAHKR